MEKNKTYHVTVVNNQTGKVEFEAKATNAIVGSIANDEDTGYIVCV